LIRIPRAIAAKTEPTRRRKASARMKLYRDLLKVTRKTVGDAERVADELTHAAPTDWITADALQ